MRWLFCMCLLAVAALTQARHIIGGELTMRYLGTPGLYRVQMDQYWNGEILSTNTGLNDPSVTVYIYRANSPILVQTIILPLVSETPLVYNNAACATTNKLKSTRGTYYLDIQFDPANYADAGGYYMVWERCCRDNTIVNLASNTGMGMVFYLEFPAMIRNGTAFTNSSPQFGLPNGEYLCLNRPVSFAFSASDADGDQLVYSLVTPYRGYTTDDPNQVRGTPEPKNGYPLVPWGAGYSATNAIPGNPPLQVNAQTGVLTVTPNAVGYFVFAVQCDEYRNGQRIGSIRRDFSLPVLDCPLTPIPPPVILAAGNPTPTLTVCAGASTTLTVDADPQWAYQWQLGGLNISGATRSSLVADKAGAYTVIRSRPANCVKEEFSQTIQVIDGLGTSDVVADSIAPTCLTGSAIALTAQPLNGVWSGAGTLGAQFNPAQAGVGVHRLTYTVTPAGGCPSSAVRWARVTPPLTLSGPVSYQVQRGGAVQLTQVPSQPAATVAWSPPLFLDDPSSTTPLCSPANSQTYTVTASLGPGCVAESTVDVLVLDRLFVPTAFSPNGDPDNNLWRPQNIESFPGAEVYVYNRWGQLVYQRQGQTASPWEGWDGTFQQKPVEAGVYTYLICPAPDQPALRGSVTVIR